MGKVIDAAKYWREPNMTGKARCLACRVEWVAVAPCGTLWLECPKCHLLRGRFVNPAEEPRPHWQCQCGNDLFCVTVDGYYCPNCGLDQKGF